MTEVIAAFKKIMEIAADKKVTKEELPELLDAVVALITGLAALILPFLKGPAANVTKNIAAALKSAKG